jgi:hypothetical protein
VDQRQMADAIGKLTGVVTALEVQTQALLLAVVGSGVHPDLVLKAIRAVPQPVVPGPGREAFERAMEGFWRRLDEAAFEVLAPDKKAESGLRRDGHAG